MPFPARPTPIAFDCTTCGYVLRVAARSAGPIALCPACDALLFAPAAPPTPPPADGVIPLSDAETVAIRPPVPRRPS